LPVGNRRHCFDFLFHDYRYVSWILYLPVPSCEGSCAPPLGRSSVVANNSLHPPLDL
jgi:hypothetical protein